MFASGCRQVVVREGEVVVRKGCKGKVFRQVVVRKGNVFRQFVVRKRKVVRQVVVRKANVSERLLSRL